jgi:hypothetical protein
MRPARILLPHTTIDLDSGVNRHFHFSSPLRLALAAFPSTEQPGPPQRSLTDEGEPAECPLISPSRFQHAFEVISSRACAERVRLMFCLEDSFEA